MKNCLIVLVVLVGCLLVAAFLVYGIETNFGRGFPGGTSLEVAEWRDYNDPAILGLEVIISPDQIDIEIPAAPVFKQVIEKGHWDLHAFYCDSHVESPPEIEVARETKNEDLVVNIGRWLPSHSGKITLVKSLRGGKDEHPPYPVEVPGQTVAYPPPKGLIRQDMLACDLQTLPWHADRIDISTRREYNQENDDQSEVYTYHSDRPDAPKLLVTVYHGRVTDVNGGAEETADIPYQLPAPAPPADETPAHPDRSWAGWLFDLIFTK